MDATTLAAINKKLANDDANRTFFKFVLNAAEGKVRGVVDLLGADADEFDDDVIRFSAEQEMERQGFVWDKPTIKES